MHFDYRTALLAVFLALVCLAAPVVRGDEGMWLFNNVPEEHLQKAHDFKAVQRVARTRPEIVGPLQ